MLELVGFGSDSAATHEVATRLGGMAYANHPTERDERPYSAMIRVATDNVEAVRSVSDVGMYVCFSRVIKAPVSRTHRRAFDRHVWFGASPSDDPSPM